MSEGTATSAGTRAPSRAARVAKRALVVCAVAYPFALAALVAALRLVGERWWVTTAALYLPRAPLALPLAVFVPVLWFWGPRRLLWSQAVAAVLVAVPLMGFRLSLSARPEPNHPTLRILSYNVNSTARGPALIGREIDETAPDVVLMQELSEAEAAWFKANLGGDYTFHFSTQFLVASRYPIGDVYEPAKLSHRGVLRSARFIAYTVAVPGGPIRLFNVHPISPREGLEELRGDGLREEIASGRLLRGAGAHLLMANASLRRLQAEAIADAAAGSPHPVVIAGDTNLPGLSRTFAKTFAGYQDGFEERGSGFGYTYPVTRRLSPWMRIDRILAGPGLRFISFSVGPAGGSDHLSVRAELQIVR